MGRLTLRKMKRFEIPILLLAVVLVSGCITKTAYTVGRNSALNLTMPAAGKSKVVFVRPNPLYRDFMFNIHDGERLIGTLPYYSFFEYECEPGLHRFSATIEDDLKVMEANLLPDRIYYAKIAARYGFSSPGVNMYSLFPGCAGDLWPQMPKILADLKEAIVAPEEVENHEKGAAAYLKRLKEYRASPEVEVILPEHGQTQPVRDR